MEEHHVSSVPEYSNRPLGRVIGIDLSGSSICMAVMINGRPRVIPWEDGTSTMPAQVAYVNGKTYVGQAAEPFKLSSPKNVITQALAFIGRKLREVLKVYGSDESCSLAADSDDGVVFQIDETNIRPEQVVAKLLAVAKERAEQFLGESVSQVVFAVPAYFDDAIQAPPLLAAGRSVGFEIITLLRSSLAAALGYGLHGEIAKNIVILNPTKYHYGYNRSNDIIILVFDLGRYAFSASLLYIANWKGEIVESVWDRQLGADAIFAAIIDQMAEDVQKVYSIDLRGDKGALRQLRAITEKFLYVLAYADEASFPCSFSVNGETIQGVFCYSCSYIEKIILKILRPALAQWREHCFPRLRDITLFVGDGCQYPLIQKLLVELSRSIIPSFCGNAIDAREVVAIGVAIQAGLLSNSEFSPSDSIPLTLSVGFQSGQAYPMIQAGSSIPNRSQTLIRCDPRAYTEPLFICRGSHQLVMDNIKIAKLPCPLDEGNNEVTICVTLAVDTTGILNASILNLSTGDLHTIQVEGVMDVADSASEVLRIEERSRVLSKAKNLLLMADRAIKFLIPFISFETQSTLLKFYEGLRRASDEADRDAVVRAMRILRSHRLLNKTLELIEISNEDTASSVVRDDVTDVLARWKKQLAERALNVMLSGGTEDESSSDTTKKFQPTAMPIVSPIKPTAKPIIGIDFGRTHLRLAVMRNGFPKIIPASLSSRTPLLLTYKQGLWGFDAQAQAYSYEHPEHTIADLFRYLGRDSQAILNDLDDIPDNLVFLDGKPQFRMEGQLFSLEDLLVTVFGQVKVEAQDFLEQTIHQAIVAFPQHWGGAQLDILKTAAMRAGIEIVQFLAQPFAITKAYGFTDSKSPQIIATYDLGAHTFNVSILRVGNGNCELLATRSDTELGGSNIDAELCEDLLGQLHYFEPKLLSKNTLRLVRQAAEEIKVASDIGKFVPKKICTDLAIAMNSPYQMLINGSKIEKWALRVIEQTQEVCQAALKDANLKLSDIQYVIPAGGAATPQTILDMIRCVAFPGRELRLGIPPSDVSVIGAAIQAALIVGIPCALPKLLPFSLCLEGPDGDSIPLLKRGTALPTQRTIDLTTPSHEPRTLRLAMGDRLLMSDNREIGRLDIPLIKSTPPTVSLTIGVSADGSLDLKVAITTGDLCQQHFYSMHFDNILDLPREVPVARQTENDDWKNAYALACLKRGKQVNVLVRALLEDCEGRLAIATERLVRERLDESELAIESRNWNTIPQATKALESIELIDKSIELSIAIDLGDLEAVSLEKRRLREIWKKVGRPNPGYLLWETVIQATTIQKELHIPKLEESFPRIQQHEIDVA